MMIKHNSIYYFLHIFAVVITTEVVVVWISRFSREMTESPISFASSSTQIVTKSSDSNIPSVWGGYFKKIKDTAATLLRNCVVQNLLLFCFWICWYCVHTSYPLPSDILQHKMGLSIFSSCLKLLITYLCL